MKDEIKPGEQLTLAQINRIRKQAQAAKQEAPQSQSSASKPSDGLKVDELRAALEAKGIEIPEGSKKADLQRLLDEADTEDE